MIEFLCKLWPYLAGGLIGWLAAGWFARRFRHSEPPVEKIVEKQIDNPQHLALISKLESENKDIAGLRTKLAGYESATPKTVDNPAHLKRISELESQVSSLKSSSSSMPQTAMSATTKTVDNPAHIKRISELEAQVKNLRNGPEIDLAAAKAAGFKLKNKDDLTAIEGIGPKINDLMKADGIKTFADLSDSSVPSIQTVLDNAGPRYQIANPGTWPDQANLAANNRWPALAALQDVLVGGVYPNASESSSNKSKSTASNKKSATPKKAAPKKAKTVEVDKDAAKAAGFRVKVKAGKDDFTVVEGIGPKINDLIHAAGINRYAELGRTKVEVIQKILDDAGPRYTLAKPGTWPAQADMAAENKWEALKAWQDELDGGK